MLFIIKPTKTGEKGKVEGNNITSLIWVTWFYEKLRKYELGQKIYLDTTYCPEHTNTLNTQTPKQHKQNKNKQKLSTTTTFSNTV